MSVRITCISKDNGNHYNRHEAISALGWIDEVNSKSGNSTRLEMVQFLEKGGKSYVKDRFGNYAYLAVLVSNRGNKYVQTHADGKYTNNLLELPECK